MPRLNAAIVAPVVLLLATLGAGCGQTIGLDMSQDRFTFDSTAHSPKSIDVIDTRTGGVIWTYEIPVGHRVDLRFSAAQKSGAADNPELMYWGFGESEAGAAAMKNTVAVPPANSRRMDVTVRPHPEVASVPAAPLAK